MYIRLDEKRRFISGSTYWEASVPLYGIADTGQSGSAALMGLYYKFQDFWSRENADGTVAVANNPSLQQAHYEHMYELERILVAIGRMAEAEKEKGN